MIITLPHDYRLKWSAMSIDAQVLVERKNRKTGETYEDWADIGYYGKGTRGYRQALTAVLDHWASQHGEVAPQELSDALNGVSEAIAGAVERVEKAV